MNETEKRWVKDGITAGMTTFRARRSCSLFTDKRAREMISEYVRQGSNPALAGETLARVESHEKGIAVITSAQNESRKEVSECVEA